MFGLPFPTYLGWLLGPGVMIFTFLTSLILYKNYLKKEAAEEAEKNSKDSNGHYHACRYNLGV